MISRKFKIILGVIILLLIVIFLHKNYGFIGWGKTENFYVAPFNTKTLYKNPDITLIKDFLTPEECEYIIKIGDPHIRKSEVCGRGGSRPDNSRTSMTAHIGKKFLGGDNPDKVLLGILDKVEKYSGLSTKNVEPIQLVRYEPGQYFKPHYDYLDRKIPMYAENIKKNGQRKYTFFCYLTDVPSDAGGTTYFPKINKHFKGGKGDAIFWDNILESGEEDKRMLHSGDELKKGKKYGLNIWVRDKEYKG
jgi:prolyl 4-hydroxylase